MGYIGKGPSQVFRTFSVKDSFTGDGSTTVFTLSRAAYVGSPNDVQVFVDNVRQEPGSGKAYTIELDGSSNATQLTFSSAPPNASEIYVIIAAEPTSVLVPAAGTITSEMIADGTVVAADIDDGTVTNAKLTNSSITVSGDSGSDGVSLGETLTVSGTSNEIETVVTSNTLTIGLPNDVTIAGNLTVSGTTTTISTTNTTISDNLLELNSGVASNANDSGLIIERGSTGDNAIMAWDESADEFIFGTTTATASDTGDLTITAADVNVGAITTTGLTTTGNINFGDNDKAQFGAGNDLQIFHDGNNSFINELGTGSLYVRAQNTFNLQKAGTSEFMLKTTTDGAVELYYDNSKKFETTSTGVDVRTTTSGAESKLRVSSNNATGDNDATVVISNSGTGDAMLRFDYEESNTDRARLGTSASGQNLLFFTAGANERMRIDSSGRVGIGTSSPATALEVESASGQSVTLNTVSGSGGINFELNGTRQCLIENNASDASLKLEADVDNAYANSDIIMKVDGTEHMRIDSSGNVAVGSTSTTEGKFRIDTSDANQDILRLNGINGSYTEETIFTNVTRSATANYSFLVAYSNDTADMEFNLRGDGNAFADGSFSGGGADYAEYFEWSDGNTDNEDRRGYTVVLDGNMIRKATDTDNASEIIGVISSDPVVVGDASWNKWTNKHLKDDFGSYISEEHNVVEWVEQELVEEAQGEVYDEEGNVVEEAKEAVYREKKHSYEDWNIPEGIIVPDDAEIKTHDDKGNRFQHRKVNPDYDPNIEYIPREQRKEWDAVGLMGKLRMRKGQPVGDRWIKMRDISDTVEEWLIK